MIEQLYKTGLQMLPYNPLALIWKPKEQVMKLPLPAKQQWIELVEVAKFAGKPIMNMANT